MKNQTRIFLVRHGESEHNINQVFSGHGNPHLTTRGRQQAAQARERLKSIQFDVAYSSPLDRAKETAAIIVGQPVPKSNLLPELKERNWGALEGKLVSHAKEQEALRASLPRHRAWHFKHVDDMESDHEVALRFVNALQKLAEKHSGQTILVVAHGGTVRTSITRLNGFENRFVEPHTIKNADVVEIGYVNGQLKALRLNGEKI